MTRAALLSLSLSAALALGFAGGAPGRWAARHRDGARHSAVSSGSLGGRIAPGGDASSDDARADARRALLAGEPGTYIGEILAEHDSALVRWPERRDAPLTVWIQPRSSVKDFDGVYVEQVRQAFEEWDRVRLPVRFSFVGDSAAAEVHVAWVDRFSEPISGRTRWSRDDDWMITDANILLALHHNHGEPLDRDAMHAMALHEIGHLLGLDHTSDTLSIMTPTVRVRELSDADRATARLLYSLPAGSLQ